MGDLATRKQQRHYLLGGSDGLRRNVCCALPHHVIRRQWLQPRHHRLERALDSAVVVQVERLDTGAIVDTTGGLFTLTLARQRTQSAASIYVNLSSRGASRSA